ncbi:hypothetical protein VTL71DRAFT_6287 [Oculimacula yallundae]|uniref:Zn(2)-C6 fungal-type domain-containing protein n=1 Tax=Oculimacula yallundae TaxID=86028 RepID=A0ABR4BWL8_9HELO
MDARSVIKKRRSNPKTKTGCLTCKIRRVKCGEEKPSCSRCIKYRVVCDGYVAPESRQKVSRASSNSSRDLLPKTIFEISVQTAFSRSPFKDATEYQYFDLFCSRTALAIFPESDSGSTRRMMLQSCHTNPALRHAIIAIGALDKTSETARDFRNLSVDGSTGTSSSNEHHRAALQQYTKAVSLMRSSNQPMGLRAALLNCLVILCFEAWNGSLDLAVQQVQTAIRLILEWKANSENPLLGSANGFVEVNFLEDDLVQIFCRLAIQVCFFASDRSLDCKAIIRAESTELSVNMPKVFTSVTEATLYHQGVLRRGMTFASCQKRFENFAPSDVTPEVYEEFLGHVDAFDRWLAAFKPLSKVVEHRENFDDPTAVRKAKSLELSMKAAYISLSGCLSTDQMIYDDFNDMYREVIDLCEDVLNDTMLPSKFRNTSFCFDSRLILPLYFLGLQCREPKLRRRAINLLSSWPKREGVWDTLFAAKVGGWAMMIEEKHMEDNIIPGWARVRNVSWTSDLEKRTATLYCRQRKSADSQETVPRRKMISW